MLILVSLIAVCNIFYNFTPQENIEEKIAVLKKVVTEIDNDDFSFLDEILQDKRIVMLGEQIHSDGTTFELKSQIIKYLHENHGYNVVLYEAGLYDMWCMDSQDTINPQRGLYGFWWNNDESRPIWDYYRATKQSENPVILGGFDVQLTGQISDSIRKELIENHLSDNNIDINDFSAFVSVVGRLSNNWLWEYATWNTETKISKDFLL